MSYLSISTWSLHRLLGPLRWTEWDAAAGTHKTRVQSQPQILTLLDLPAEAARRGYRALEVCHFHFPSTETTYLEKLRQSFSAAGLTFDTLLLDYGDLTTIDEARLEADQDLFRHWIDIASLAGAKNIRIIAGDASPSNKDAVRNSAAALCALADYASGHGVRVITENFHSLTSTGESCASLMQQTEGKVGMITDFGNFNLPSKYDEFAITLPHSVSVHAKADYDPDGMPDEAEYRRCLDTMKASGYNGPVVLIYDGPDDMWEGLERIRRIVEPYL
ncbi:sugar phosphate isomerase/epimerase [Paenibacillus sp. sptzw28]|uniref:sugar phosphate isomerase/epimerase family protein n=1 Tax=Paenibacillus sp. sptzw28 TaxID=715179 RepID=UPI001C6EEB2F|nr:TIM barrel protein [Paenibacillus sp. sptzw28]QYR19302.1 sugar phosphate isomerase/epimerase [Paenibacillus sp. sptzw28]